MPPSRVKESCIPCRQRRSRCDGQFPCAPCNVHNTENTCQYASGRPAVTKVERRATAAPYPMDGISPPMPVAGPSSHRNSMGSPSAAIAEIQRLKSSIASLESHIYQLENVPTPKYGEDVTDEEKENWERIKANLPSRFNVEVLLEFVIQECDWLWLFGDVANIWRTVCARGGCSKQTAGLLCMHLVQASLILGMSENIAIYRPDQDISKLHLELYTLAEEFQRAVGYHTVEDLALVMTMVEYLVFSGRLDDLQGMMEPAIQLALRLNLFDEGDPSWYGFSGEEREERRWLAWDVITKHRWSSLMPIPDAFEGIRMNVCRPKGKIYPLNTPLSLPQLGPYPETGSLPPPFRVLRVKSELENARTISFIELTMELTNHFPRIRSYLYDINIGKGDVAYHAAQCESIMRELLYWRDVKLKAEGYPEPTAASLQTTNPSSLRETAKAMLLHQSIAHVLAVTLRYWITIPEDPSIAGIVQAPRQACLDHAESTMKQVPVIRAFCMSKQAPFFAPFAAAHLFNAAMAFAVPVLRAVRKWNPGISVDNVDRETEVIPSWPNESYIKQIGSLRHDDQHPHDLPAKGPTPLPSTIYFDPFVRHCANNILLALDTLMILRASPLIKSAEKRLSNLIDQYALRDSQTFFQIPTQQTNFQNMYYPTAPPQQQQPSTVPFTNPIQDQAQRPGVPLQQDPAQHFALDGTRDWLNPHPWAGGEPTPNTQDELFQQLLQMDSSIWHELLASTQGQENAS